jgi:hypothetical protein
MWYFLLRNFTTFDVCRLTSVGYYGIDGTSLRHSCAQSTHPQPCAEAPDVAEAIDPTFAIPYNPAFQGETPCTRDTQRTPMLDAWCTGKLLWLLLDSRVVDLSRSSAPTFATLSSLNPLFFNGLRNALRFSDKVGA